MFPSKKNESEYTPVETDSSVDLDAGDHFIEKEQLWLRKPSRSCAFVQKTREWLFNPFFTIVNIILFFFSLHVLWKNSQIHHERNEALKKVSLYSPLLDRLDYPLVDRLSGAQHRNEPLPIWRSPPSKDVDRAWERIVDELIFPLTASEVIGLGGDPSVVVKLPEQYNIDGEQAYMSKPAVFHNLHCLNYIRKSLYADYYWPNGTYEMPFHESHISHCIMIMYERLTCSPDPALHLFHWQEELEVSVHDSNIWRKCVDWDRFLDDYNEHAIHGLEDPDIKKPAGVKVLPMPDAVKKILGDWRETHPDDVL